MSEFDWDDIEEMPNPTDVLADLRLGRQSADLAKLSAEFDLRRALARMVETYGKPEAKARVLELLAEVVGEGR